MLLLMTMVYTPEQRTPQQYLDDNGTELMILNAMAYADKIYALHKPDAYINHSVPYGRWEDAPGALMATNADPEEKARDLRPSFLHVAKYVIAMEMDEAELSEAPPQTAELSLERAITFAALLAEHSNPEHEIIVPPRKVIVAQFNDYYFRRLTRSTETERYIAGITDVEYFPQRLLGKSAVDQTLTEE